MAGSSSAVTAGEGFKARKRSQQISTVIGAGAIEDTQEGGFWRLAYEMKA
jgi:hypothetical protein